MPLRSVLPPLGGIMVTYSSPESHKIFLLPRTQMFLQRLKESLTSLRNPTHPTPVSKESTHSSNVLPSLTRSSTEVEPGNLDGISSINLILMMQVPQSRISHNSKPMITMSPRLLLPSKCGWPRKPDMTKPISIPKSWNTV